MTSSDNLLIERSLVVIKPDGVQRGLVGEIIKRLERTGLKLVAAKLVQVDSQLVGEHYEDNPEYHQIVGEKTLSNYRERGADPVKELGTDDPVEVGRIVRKWNMNYLSQGPVLAMVWQGYRATSIIRKLTGHTFPEKADPGTIRGDLAIDGVEMANVAKRSVINLLHASGNAEEAEREIKLWFKDEEIYQYQRSDDPVLSGEMFAS